MITEAMPCPPSIQMMITEAISSLKEKSGSSQHAIAKFIGDNHYAGSVTPELKRMLSTQLKELTKSGKLVQVKRSFKLPPVPKEEEKKIEEKELVLARKTGDEIWSEVYKLSNEMTEIRKYVERIERLCMKPRISNKNKEELIQKEKDSLEEWKKAAAAISSAADLALVGSVEKLMEVQHELDRVEETTLSGLQKVEDIWNQKLWDVKQQTAENDHQELIDLYNERSKIIETIPNFWSTTFRSHSGFQSRLNLNGVDNDIVKYLNEVVVKGCPEVTSCTITFKFDENPFFENSSLTKTLKFFQEGISDVTETTTIIWKTDMHESFFAWFEDHPTEMMHDVVANLIGSNLWCYAADYFVTTVKAGSSKDNLGSSGDKLMKVHKKIRKAEENAARKRCALRRYYELETRKEQKAVIQDCMESQRPIYNKRSEIIKTIPSFWLTAFSSHYALGVLLSEDDRKIFKFLESVDVEDTEVGGIPGYTINLNFGENQYFENETLTKKISYSSRGMDIQSSDIKWKVIPMGIQQESLVEKRKKWGCADDEISFFTWFSDNANDSVVIDEVAVHIIHELWPNAVKYFVNLSDEEEYAINEECRYLSCSECSED